MGNCVATANEDVAVIVQKAPAREAEEVIAISEPSDQSFQAFYPDLQISKKQKISMDPPMEALLSGDENGSEGSVTSSTRVSESNSNTTSMQPLAKVRVYAREA
jgi:hypothetical protein